MGRMERDSERAPDTELAIAAVVDFPFFISFFFYYFFPTFIVRYFHRARALFSLILNMDLGNGAFRMKVATLHNH